MKALKYMSVALVLAAALASCSKDFLDAEDYSVLTPDEAAAVAAKNADSYLNGIWSANVDASETDEFGLMSTLLYFEFMTEDIASSMTTTSTIVSSSGYAPSTCGRSSTPTSRVPTKSSVSILTDLRTTTRRLSQVRLTHCADGPTTTSFRFTRTT